jgi:hypothetical protein
VHRALAFVFFAALPLGSVIALADEPHTTVIVVPPPEAGPDTNTMIPRDQPDPPPLAVRPQWIWDLRWSKGDIYLLGVREWDPGAVRETPRVMGRFAIELWEGKTLLERVRFDFPGLGAPEDGGHFALPSFQAKLTTRVGVIFPQAKRGTRFELVDRATNTRWDLPWPTAADGG